MIQCFKCKFLYNSEEIKTFPSGKGYCSACLLWSWYKCEHCQQKFTIGDYSVDYNEGKKIAWKEKLDHVKAYHN